MDFTQLRVEILKSAQDLTVRVAEVLEGEKSLMTEVAECLESQKNLTTMIMNLVEDTKDILDWNKNCTGDFSTIYHALDVKNNYKPNDCLRCPRLPDSITCAVTMSMNEPNFLRVLDADCTTGVGTQNQLTRFNIVALFLTLQLCQLTQPYGSLLFRQGKLFLWRFNPMASFTEGCIIYWHLAKALKSSWRLGYCAVLDSLQEMSAGLLFVRGILGPDPNFEYYSTMLPPSMLKQNSKADAEGAATVHNPAKAQSPGKSADARQTSTFPCTQDLVQPPPQALCEPGPVRRDTPRASRPPLVVARPEQEAIELAQMREREHSTKTLRPPFALDIRDARVQNRAMTKKESNYARQQLRQALGVDVMVRRQLRVDLVTSLSAITIFIKLTVMRMNPWFSAICYFIVFGWSAVQILLVLVHRKQMTRQQELAALRRSFDINSHVGNMEWIWRILFVFAHAPFLAYYHYLINFRPWDPLPLRDLSSPRLEMVLSLVILYMFFILGSVLGGLFVVVAFESLWPKVGYFATLTLGFSWLVISTTSYIRQNVDVFCQNCQSHRNTMFREDTMLHYIIDKSLEPLGKSSKIFANTIFVSMTFLVFAKFGDTQVVDKKTRQRGKLLLQGLLSVGNVALTVIAFTLFTLFYDPSKTFKPNWTEILG